jgi:hypothetical protein
MRRSTIHHLIATVCLAAFGLGQALSASLGVRCTDALGKTRIEYACDKNAQGLCLAACTEAEEQAAEHADDACCETRQEGESSGGGTPTPCEDVPLKLQAASAKMIASGDPLKSIAPAVVVAILWDHRSSACAQSGGLQRPVWARERDRPPDTVARLRSCIIVI